MAKFKKVIKIIVISMAIALGLAFLVLYIIDKDMANNILNTIVEYANKPLPIVGVSLLVLAGLAWKIFSASSYGKKAIAKMKAEYEFQKQELIKISKEKEIKYSSIIVLQNRKIDLLTNNAIDALKAIPNKKVQLIACNLEEEAKNLKQSVDDNIQEIVDSSVQVIIESKEELTNKIVERVKKEISDNYGKEEINNSTEKE